MPLAIEEFGWVADKVDLWGAEREVLQLHCCEDLPPAEIALRLHLTPEQVATHLANAEVTYHAHQWPANDYAEARQVLEVFANRDNSHPTTPAPHPLRGKILSAEELVHRTETPLVTPPGHNRTGEQDRAARVRAAAIAKQQAKRQPF